MSSFMTCPKCYGHSRHYSHCPVYRELKRRQRILSESEDDNYDDDPIGSIAAVTTGYLIGEAIERHLDDAPSADNSDDGLFGGGDFSGGGASGDW